MNKLITSLVAGFGAMIAIALLVYLGHFIELSLVMAPFGATAVLIFALPKSPLAQPKNVILGHFITALIGVVFVQFIGVTPFTLALATGLGVSAMLLSDSTHPPAGANPLLIMMTGKGWMFLVTPVLIGAVMMVVVGKLMQRLQQRMNR